VKTDYEMDFEELSRRNMSKTTAANPPKESFAVAAGEVGTVESTGLILQAEAAVAVNSLYDEMIADSGEGTRFEPGQIKVPFLTVLDPKSPAVLEQSEKYVDGARPGMVLNTVTNKVFDTRRFPGRKDDPKGIRVVFAAFDEKLVEWIDRDEGGGFVTQHAIRPGTAMPADPELARRVRPHPVKTRELQDPETGHILVLTHYHFPLVVDVESGSLSWAIIGMSSSQLDPSRLLNSFLVDVRLPNPKGGKFKPPVYGLVFDLLTKTYKNAKGEWWGWEIKYIGPVADVFAPADAALVYGAAKKYREAVMSGIAKATPTSDEAVEEKENIPF
jgi:hypothetical protein